MPPRKQLKGKKFGNLLVIKCTGETDKFRDYLWECVCDCGRNHIVPSRSLTSGNTKSCGCSVGRPGRTKRSLPHGEGSLRYLISRYKSNAKRRQLEWNLSKEQFKNLTTQNCHYCDTKPNLEVNSGKHNGKYIYNGIDRVNNNKGYTLENCIPCCKYCNQAKSDRTTKEFADWIKDVYFHFVIDTHEIYVSE